MKHTTSSAQSAPRHPAAIERHDAMDLVLEIAAQASNPEAMATLQPTLSGLGGPILLHLRLLEATGEARYEENLASALDRLIDGADSLRSYDLEQGVAGLGWLVDHVGRATGAIVDLADLHAALEHVFRKPWFGDVGRLRGLAGVGVWALCSDSANAKSVLASVIKELDRTAGYELDGRSWPPRINMSPSGLSADAEDEAVDYSAAHGVAGVVDVLAAAVQAGAMDDIAASLLEGAVPWLLARCTSSDSSLRWCDGELSIMTSVLAAAEALKQGDWHQSAAERVRAIIDTNDSAAEALAGPSLRTGWAGATRTLQRLARTLPSPSIGAAAQQAVSHLEAACRVAIAEPTPRLGLLDGLSGAALVLLDTIVGETRTDWDRFLFTTLDTPGGLRC